MASWHVHREAPKSSSSTCLAVRCHHSLTQGSVWGSERGWIWPLPWVPFLAGRECALAGGWQKQHPCRSWSADHWDARISPGGLGVNIPKEREGDEGGDLICWRLVGLPYGAWMCHDAKQGLCQLTQSLPWLLPLGARAVDTAGARPAPLQPSRRSAAGGGC